MLNIDDQPLKAIRRNVSKKIRSGAAVSEVERADYDRAVRVLDYLAYRPQRGVRINGWWNLPVAAGMWAADAADRRAV